MGFQKQLVEYEKILRAKEQATQAPRVKKGSRSSSNVEAIRRSENMKKQTILSGLQEMQRVFNGNSAKHSWKQRAMSSNQRIAKGATNHPYIKNLLQA